MNISQIYIAIGIAALAIIAILMLVVGKRWKAARLTPVAGLAFAFILAGIFVTDNRLVGYGLMAVGVALAVADMYLKLKGR